MNGFVDCWIVGLLGATEGSPRKGTRPTAEGPEEATGADWEGPFEEMEVSECRSKLVFDRISLLCQGSGGQAPSRDRRLLGGVNGVVGIWGFIGFMGCWLVLWKKKCVLNGDQSCSSVIRGCRREWRMWFF